MAQPLIIEVAINGLISKDKNPNVPLGVDEVVEDCLRCIEAGASIVHAHAGDPYVGKVERHRSEPYIEAFEPVLKERPDAILYPTLPAGPYLPIEDRYAHIDELVKADILSMAPIDPGTMNWGEFIPEGDAEKESLIYQNTFADVRYAFEYCSAHGLACTMSIFEPGFLQIVLAHEGHGTLPRASVVKLEFSAGRMAFGMPVDETGIAAYLSMLSGSRMPWLVNLRDGDLMNGFGHLAIKRGGHVRVGIEDYGGGRVPSNVELVSEIAELGRTLGRPPATPSQAAEIIGMRQP